MNNLCHIAHNVVIARNRTMGDHGYIGGSGKLADNSCLATGAITRGGNFAV